MWNQFTAQATTSVNGSQLSLQEMTLGLDRHDLKSDGKLQSAASLKDVTSYKSTTLGAILSSDKFIKFDLLARNVIDEGYQLNAKVQAGANGKVQEIKTADGKRFRQVGTSYYGNIDD